ncbi:hypothetical protein [Streptomyces sp. MP131-18]|uniref:hypothetical protein n=1 Tax=Streptomyces sp. MP131-18 TaxID=1857892 RepID=UPI0009CD1E91|nr:hypothetical protein [Streptomyces sp. MP131-18]ONK13136.1 hypothetical protein STBA_38980 [Streptomyces sp. MP131-18]
MTERQQPSAVGRQFVDEDGRRGVVAVLESGTVAELRTGQPVFLDLNLIGMGRWPLGLCDGGWMERHPDVGLVAPGPVIHLTGEEFADLAAGQTVHRSIEVTPLWASFPLRLTQVDSLADPA